MKGKKQTRTLLLMSGGLDSSICAYIHSELEGGEVEGLYVYEGFESDIEAECAKRIAEMLDIKLRRKNFTTKVQSGSMVFYRNLKMLIKASELAVKLNFDEVSIGTNDGPDGYPDATADAIDLFEEAINRSMVGSMNIVNPVQSLEKDTAVALLSNLAGDDFVSSIFEYGTSCDTVKSDIVEPSSYVVKEKPWGIGCGDCSGCQTRRKIYKSWETER